MEKPLQYSEELGWNWHKSWNIPAVSIRFDVLFVRKIIFENIDNGF